MNCSAIVYTLLFNICRFFIPTFHKSSHPNQWKVIFIKNITILIFSGFLIMEKKLLLFPEKKPIVFARTELPISNEESYLVRSKQFREFHKRNGHFLCMNINSLNLSGS